MTRANLLASVLYRSALTVKRLDPRSLRRKRDRERAVETLSMMQFLTGCLGMRQISDEQTEIILSVLGHTHHCDVSELGNGGFRMRVFAPATVQEATDMVYAAFDYADRDRNPVLILSDGVSAVMRKNGDSAWRCMAAFHNLPRAFLSLGDTGRISPQDAWEWSKSYLKLD